MTIQIPIRLVTVPVPDKKKGRIAWPAGILNHGAGMSALSGIPVVGGGPVVPDHDHLLLALKIPDGAHMTLAPVLLAPLPVGSPDHPAANPLHHEAGAAACRHHGARIAAAATTSAASGSIGNYVVRLAGHGK